MMPGVKGSAAEKNDDSDDDDVQILDPVKDDPEGGVDPTTTPMALVLPPPAPRSPPLQSGLEVLLKQDPQGQRRAGEQSQMAPSGNRNWA